jgi:hypothetical protein
MTLAVLVLFTSGIMYATFQHCSHRSYRRNDLSCVLEVEPDYMVAFYYSIGITIVCLIGSSLLIWIQAKNFYMFLSQMIVPDKMDTER